jgi:hypothetical protein
MEEKQAFIGQAMLTQRTRCPRLSHPILIAMGLVILIFSGWLLGGLGAIPTAYAYLRGETLFVDSHMKSFGIVAPGDPITVSFDLENRGDRPLRIVGCEAGCGCIVPDYLPFTLNPKESRAFSISILNRKKVDDNQIRSFNSDLTLFTTNPNQSRLVLNVKGEIRH